MSPMSCLPSGMEQKQMPGDPVIGMYTWVYADPRVGRRSSPDEDLRNRRSRLNGRCSGLLHLGPL